LKLLLAMSILQMKRKRSLMVHHISVFSIKNYSNQTPIASASPGTQQHRSWNRLKNGEELDDFFAVNSLAHCCIGCRVDDDTLVVIGSGAAVWDRIASG
jgi:hypothetical protein